MRRLALLTIITLFALAAPAAAQWWMPVRTHPHKAHKAQHKFVSHYCQTTQSPYTGGPQAQICCKWHPAWPDIPDGAGTWDCTIATIPLTAGTGSSVEPSG